MNRLLVALIGMTVAGVAGAKLPPPSADAQAKAAEAKDKTAWSDKVAAYQLCLAQDKVAAYYRRTKGAEVTTAMAAAAIPPCQNPGPYVAAQAAAKVGVADSLPVPAAGKPPAPAEVKK
jgi:hypothetical protein